MKRKRIGNDIHIAWSLLMKDGSKFLLEGKDLSIGLKTPYGKQEILDYSVNGNVIEWTFLGKEQKFLGKYSLILVVNKNSEGMVTTDACNFVELVACSCEANGADDAGVQTESIDLVSNVEIGGGGADIDPSDYLTKSDAEETYQPKENIYYFEWDSKIGGGSGKLDEATYQAIMAADKVCLKDGESITEPTIMVKNDADCFYGYVADKRYVLFVSESNYSIITTPYYDDKEIKDNITELSAEVSGKQNTISDLETIREGAAKGATALQSVPDTYATKQYVENLLGTIINGDY